MLASVALVSYASEERIRLAEGGVLRAEIVVPAVSNQVPYFAALELQGHLREITGGKCRIVTEDNRTPGAYPIFIGRQKETSCYDVSRFADQQNVMDVTAERTILLGDDLPGDRRPELVFDFDSTNAVPGLPAVNRILRSGYWPAGNRPHGSLDATYDFLRDLCGVRWLDSTEAGTVLPHDPNLSIVPTNRFDAPFMTTRFIWGNVEKWDANRTPDEFARYRSIAYPWAHLQDRPNAFVSRAIELHKLRQKVGGPSRSCNHSFYQWYDRFWKENPNSKTKFEAYHPEYFSKHRTKGAKLAGADGEMFQEFDTSRKPAQLCYSSEAVIAQAVKDARAYFDFADAEVAAGRNPWTRYGLDNFALEPMDNGHFCECDRCLAARHPERKAESAELSDYWFSFVNRVAEEVEKTHPGKRIATLGYGNGRQGMPSFRIRPNVVLYFCWTGNRSPLPGVRRRQAEILAKWREAYPEKPFSIWLYNCVPYETGMFWGSLAYPGFFAKAYEEEWHFLRDHSIRDGVFHCGDNDEFEYYLGNEWQWNPSVPLKKLKDDFFASYGPAEGPIRAFYDLVEARYGDTNLYVRAGKSIGTGTPAASWGQLGTDEHLTELGRLMLEADMAVTTRGSNFEQARVANWFAGTFDYILAGKRWRKQYACATPGATVMRSAYYCCEPPSAQENDLLAGGRFDPEPWAKGCTSLVYRCSAPLGTMRWLQLEIPPDGYNFNTTTRAFFDVFGYRGDGMRLPLCTGVHISDPFVLNAAKDLAGCARINVVFPPQGVPDDLAGIEIVDRSKEKNYLRTRIAAIRAFAEEGGR